MTRPRTFAGVVSLLTLALLAAALPARAARLEPREQGGGTLSPAYLDKLLAPVAFALRNADGQGDFFDGFLPDCPAPDDADHQLGDVQEGSLKEALTFATTGACSPRPLTPQRQGDFQRRQRRALGWQSLVNAY